METLTNKEFITFIKSHEKFYEDITEISMSDFGESLIENDFKMYSLDEMCWDCELLKENTPKTTDALFYKESLDGKLTLYIIEFKFHNFNNPNARDMLEIMASDVNKYDCVSNKFKKNLRKIRNYYGDEVEFSLILKPIESLSIVIPALYEQYCKDNDLPIKDIRSFLDNVEKKLIVFVSHYDDKRKHNMSKQRVQTMDVGVENNYRRLEKGNIIDYHRIYPSFKFSYFLSYERLI
ncbi:MAG: hypothetical protein E7Z77_00685 [Methanobrevibacter sp.]|uniref:hypothetical protein n=1 Tax=Methanobrevibacter sp. TaxID=66852 RepID=UPI0025EB9DD9|nr:hypothetical protein [Methanobrevibacter sp.]MBE6507907.1 hypothetical protein [Methanobrevibacter sp.]